MWNFSKETGIFKRPKSKIYSWIRQLKQKNSLAGLDRRLDTAEDRSMEITQIGAKGEKKKPTKPYENIYDQWGNTE